MQDTYIDRGLCIFLIQMLKIVSILFINWLDILFLGVAFKHTVEIIMHYYC